MASFKHRSLRPERGFTIVEVMVAMLVLTVGILAVLGSLISAGKLTLNSQVHEAAIGFAEQQIEALRQQPFSSLGMQSPVPTPSTNVNDPNFYTQTSPTACYNIQVNYQAGGSSIGCESFVTSTIGGCTACTVPSTPQTITGYQGLTGTYDTYVTSYQDNGCVIINLLSICLTGAQKRITVAVLPTSLPGTGSRKPVWVTSIVSDPNTTPLSLP